LILFQNYIKNLNDMNNKNKTIYFILVLLLLFLQSFIRVSAINTADSLFTEGNRYYAEHDYEQAVTCYHEVIDLGYEAAELYYNLGNAYYKLNRIAPSILYYEKARKINPYDNDIVQNLNLANTRIIDRSDTVPVFFLKRWVESIINLMSTNTWAIISILFFIISLTALFMFRYKIKKPDLHYHSLFIVFLLIAILASYLSIQRKKMITSVNAAIVMDAVMIVRSSPDADGTSVFILHEGTKVKLHDSIDQWQEIEISDGTKGWAKKSAMEEI